MAPTDRPGQEPELAKDEDAAPAKKPYATPRLTLYGPIEKNTQFVNPGTADALLGSSFGP